MKWCPVKEESARQSEKQLTWDSDTKRFNAGAVEYIAHKELKEEQVCKHSNHLMNQGAPGNQNTPWQLRSRRDITMVPSGNQWHAAWDSAAGSWWLAYENYDGWPTSTLCKGLEEGERHFKYLNIVKIHIYIKKPLSLFSVPFTRSRQKLQLGWHFSTLSMH